MRLQWILNWLMAMCLMAVMCAGSEAQVIGYREMRKIDRLRKPDAKKMGEKLAEQTWLFTHANLGRSMLTGMNSLRDDDGGDWELYRLMITEQRTDRVDGFSIQSKLDKGRVYALARGNPRWDRKLKFLEKLLEKGGWVEAKHERDGRQGKRDGLVVMDMLGLDDDEADAGEYCEKMNQLEAKYRGVIFVYMTMPLKVERSEANVRRNKFNQVVRAFCKRRGKLLLDIAAIESTDANGKSITFQWDGETYERLHQHWTDDGGYLNARGQERIAKGWYAAAWAASEQRRRER
ncbi:hypothetical protein KS4_14610 [Poriferisphaera corsica]|uniref:Uncharacterized protein n=1 Tax=Poriferisphaera corsica TaxID=2528020 RepID=A0A517YT59_9BACT|nr:hypothetical protein [Poriferisphaera corsica]QDU33415.1 hypothetical protein KS4_14610 [Poriferisphaera corsica]